MTSWFGKDMDALWNRSLKIHSSRLGLFDEPVSGLISADDPGIVVVGRLVREFVAFGLVEVAKQNSGRPGERMAQWPGAPTLQ